MVSQIKGVAMTKRKAMLVYLDDDIRERLKRLSEKERVSVAQLIRWAVADYLGLKSSVRRKVVRP